MTDDQKLIQKVMKEAYRNDCDGKHKSPVWWCSSDVEKALNLFSEAKRKESQSCESNMCWECRKVMHPTTCEYCIQRRLKKAKLETAKEIFNDIEKFVQNGGEVLRNGWNWTALKEKHLKPKGESEHILNDRSLRNKDGTKVGGRRKDE